MNEKNYFDKPHTRSPWLNLLRFRAYPRLTAPIRGKSRLFALNRAKKFSGSSRACNRGCTLRTAS